MSRDPLLLQYYVLLRTQEQMARQGVGEVHTKADRIDHVQLHGEEQSSPCRLSDTST
jgi:hypothetical protein